jgi:pyruvate/2-oxoglutarate dehydrogenase complex dihydrolipoamide acyltransferase (E2) component
MVDIVSPLTGTVARVERAVGAAVDPTTPVVIVESMKMEYVIDAGADGTLAEVRVAAGDSVQAGDVLAVVAEGLRPVDEIGAVDSEPVGEAPSGTAASGAAGAGRTDLAEVVDRHAAGLDAARPDVVARRHARGHRTARENVADLVD